MGQYLLLDLARVHVRAAGDVHVGGAPRDVEEALLIHVAEIAGAEPAVPERFRVGVGIVVVAGEDRRAADADLSRLEGRQLAAVLVLDRDLHAGTLITAGADLHARTVLGVMERRRQHRDVAGDLAEPEVLDQHFPELLQRVLLILAVHRGAGVDDVPQRGVVVRVDRRVFGQHLHDRWHGEHVRDAPALNQAPRLVDIEAVTRQQHRLGPARHQHELVYAGSVRQRRQPRARHRVAWCRASGRRGGSSPRTPSGRG